MTRPDESSAAGPVAPDPRLPATEGDTAQGFFAAGAAYLLWGVVTPLFLKALDHIPAMEVVAHRVIWSVPAGALVLLWLRRTADLRAALGQPRVIAMAALTACVISLNWGVYVYSIASNQAVEASLGYYINPLISVMMGVILLGEKPSRAQWIAIAIAGVAVALLTVHVGRLPWIGLFLAMTFAIYGYLRKTLPIGPSQGFLLEVLLLTPIALLLIGWFVAAGETHFLAGSTFDTLMLVAAGPVTALPLILFATGAKGLRLSTVGIMQYTAPTLILIIAVFVFGEPFAAPQMAAFGLIWIALLIYTWSMIRQRRTG